MKNSDSKQSARNPPKEDAYDDEGFEDYNEEDFEEEEKVVLAPPSKPVSSPPVSTERKDQNHNQLSYIEAKK